MAATMSKALHLPLVELLGARKLVLLLLAAMFTQAAAAVERVSVEQLEHAVVETHGKADKDAAQRIGDMELTERLSTARLEKLEPVLPGEHARLALLALADASAFLDLPAADIPADAAPDLATQGRIMSAAADFVMATIPRLPDFSATRTTTRFQDLKLSHVFAEPIIIPNQSFLFLDKLSATVLYRDGHEVVETAHTKKGGNREPYQTGSTTHGVFGQFLTVVMSDILKGKMGWGHWERGAAGPLAVFRYAVAEEKSNYTVRYCCVLSGDGVFREFKAMPRYHGEIAVDPKSGAVLRLVVKTDLKSSQLVSRNDMMVEYGPVEISGKKYICPVKSVLITRVSDVISRGILYRDGKAFYDDIVGAPEVTAINDAVFDNYHQFRGEMHIIPADSADQDGTTPAPGPAPASPPPPTHLLP
jgi:hypothetical protein